MWADTSAHRHIPANSRLIKDATYPRAALFLDRDGVLIEDVHYLSDPAKIRLREGVSDMLQAMQRTFSIIVVTNQSGIARGYLTEADLLDLHTAMVRKFEGCTIDAIYYCPHLPVAPVAAYDQVCECRKPKPGMLRRAAREWGFDLSRSFMVGDSLRDVEAGFAANSTGILLGQGHIEYPCAVNFAGIASVINKLSSRAIC
jgi:D-glycero-D-manno-heptose 1,7-bisphosphate phosphatase